MLSSPGEKSHPYHWAEHTTKWTEPPLGHIWSQGAVWMQSSPESWHPLARRRQRPQPPACYATDIACALEASSASIFGVDPALGGGESRHLPGSLPIWTVLWLWHSPLNTTGPQVVTQPGKELQRLSLRLQTWLPASEGFTIRWNTTNRLKKHPTKIMW